MYLWAQITTFFETHFFTHFFYRNARSFDAHFHRNFVENDHSPVMSICKIVFQEAEMCYRKAILYRPIYPDAYFNLGNLVRTVSFQCLKAGQFWRILSNHVTITRLSSL